MASNYSRKWPVARWALGGLVGGIVFGALVTAIRDNLDNTAILFSGALSGGGLGIAVAMLLAWLRNFVRGAM